MEVSSLPIQLHNTQEKADTILFIHAAHAAEQGYNNDIVIITKNR